MHSRGKPISQAFCMEIDLEAIRLTVLRELPTRATWMVGGATIDFDFERSQASLKHVSAADVNGPLEANWENLLIFGDYDVANGGGAQPYLVVRLPDGAVFELDVEADSDREPFFINSNIERF